MLGSWSVRVLACLLCGLASPAPKAGPLEAPGLPNGKTVLAAATPGQAASGDPAANTALSALGFRFDDGYLDLDGNNEAMRRFWMLMALAADPDLLENPDRSHVYLSLIGDNDRSRFLRQSAPTMPTSRGSQAFPASMLGSLDWKGQDSFERADTRKRFVAEFGDAIRAMVPKLPFAVQISTNLGLGEGERSSYDGARSAFVISRSDPWSDPGTAGEIPGTHVSGSFGSVHVAKPAAFPALIPADESQARALLKTARELQARGRNERPVVKLRFTLEKARVLPVAKSFIVDTTLDSWSLIDPRNPRQPLMALPKPPAAFGKDQVASRVPAVAATVPVLDVELPRLYAMREKSALLDDKAFLLETFEVRRDVERALVNGAQGQALQSGWERMMPNSLLATSSHLLAADAQDLDRFREWTRQRIATLGDVVRMNQFSSRAGEGVKIDLARNFTVWGSDRRGDIPKDIADRVARIETEADRTVTIPSGRDMNTAIAMSTNPNWYGFDLDAVWPAQQSGPPPAQLDFRILRTRILPGSGFTLLMTLAPVKFVFRRPDGSLAERDLSYREEAGYRLDLVGLRLGTSAAKAAEELQETFRELKQSVAINDKDALYTLKIVDLSDGTINRERFILAYPKDDPEQKIVYIKRISSASAKKSTDTAADESNRRAVFQKYGEPATKFGIRYVWTSDRTTRARIESAKCYPEVGFVFDADNANYGYVQQKCGEMLAVQLVYGDSSFVLYDSTRIYRDRIEAAVRQQQKQEKLDAASKLKL